MARFMAAALAAIFLSATALAGQAPKAGTGATVPDGKIAVVNTGVFPEKILELKQKYDAVDVKYRPRLEKIRQMAEELKKLETELQAPQTGAASADKQRQLRNRYEELKRQGTREETDLHEAATRELEVAVAPIQEKLQKFLGTYATQRNIVAVFNRSVTADSGLFWFVNQGADITEDFIAEYNKANPVPAGATAPAKP